MDSFKCERFRKIEADYDWDIRSFSERAITHTVDYQRSVAETLSMGARRRKARMLNNHMARCKVCR